MQQKLIKVIAVLLTTTILYANSATVVSYAADNFLSAKALENQGTSTTNENVEFDVYYDGGKHTVSADVNAEDTKLNIALKVKKAGYLKDAVVDFSDTNFKIAKTEESDNIQAVDAENKKISFNQINNGENVTETINIALDKKDEISEDMFDRDNTIKFTGTYVNAKGEEVAVKKDIVVHTSWTASTAKAKLDYEITKYIPYSANNVSKLITQGKITSYVENSVLPIKNTNIEVNAPKINNKYPETVTVVANSTNATNGDANGDNFSKNNWSYDSTTGKITITVNNNAVNGKIQWAKNATDEFILTYIYSSDVYEAVKDSVTRVTYDASSSMNLYVQSGVNKVSAHVDGYEDQTKKIGDIVEFTANATQSISKGYIYNNKNAADENKKETEYVAKYTAHVSYADVIDAIVLKQDVDQFVTANGSEQSTTVGGVNYAYNKTLAISKQEFNKVFGENGEITILNEAGTTLATINKDTEVKDNKIVVNLVPFNTNSITIKTSKPQSEGNIIFEITKALAKNIEYSTSQLKSFTQIKTSVIGTAKNADTDIVNTESTKNIDLTEPTQKASITTSNNRLSTIVKNENVEIKVTLENDSADDTMYSNPTIRITFPANIETLTIKDSKVYFDDELEIDEGSIKSYENENGTKTLEFKLKGTQTKYNNAAAKGATIVLSTDITLNKLTPTTNTQITAEITNGDSTVTTVSTDVKYIAPSGVVTTNSMTGYNGDEKIEVINGESQKALIPTKAEQKEVTYTMNVINNYENTLDHVVVLGRTPFKDNKDVSTSLSLGSNITMPLASGITVTGVDTSKVTVYYSENGEATTDLSNSQNGWTTSVTDYTKIKSYMIVLNEDYTMNSGDTFIFTYKATLPANLDYDQSVYENYGVFFNNNKTSGTIEDKAIATKIGLTTGNIAKLDAKLTSTIGEGASVKSGETLEYELTINNIGALDANNVKVEIKLPPELSFIPNEGDNYTFKTIEPSLDDTDTLDQKDKENTEINGDDYNSLLELANKLMQEDNKYLEDQYASILVLDLGKINANSTTKKTLKFTAKSYENVKVEVKASVSYDNAEPIATNTISNIIEKVSFNTQIVSKYTSRKEGENYSFQITLQSSQDSYSDEYGSEDNNRKNTVVTFNLPDELEYESIQLTKLNEDTAQYDDITSTTNVKVKGKKVTVNIGEVDGERGKILTVNAKVGKLSDGVYKKDVTVTSNVKADGTETENIKDISVTINKPGVSVAQTANIPEGTTISAGEDFVYTFTAQNLSDIYLNDVEFTDALPKEVQFKYIEVIYEDGTIDNEVDINGDGSVNAKFYLLAGQKITINVHVAANSIDNDTDISNKAKFVHEDIGEVETNSVAHVIKHFEKTDVNVDPDDNNKETRKVIGTVWVDSNKDGVKDANEQRVSGVKVLLLDNSTSNIAISSNNEQCITTTGTDGSYMFNNVPQGKYSVIFFYDSAKYSPTTYKKSGVSEEQNSDAIDKTVNYEGKDQIAAVTEEIVLSDTNKFNIDLGIVEDAKFDLKLDKIVQAITVNNGKNTTEHVYNSKLAKIDFESKYAKTSSMVVEYKFTITNEGGIAGYVKKLADYLPEGLKFNSELNKDWYEGKDGVIYNASLANTIINPGESKEVTLILTKNINGDNDFGLINNSAEIYETSNDYGVLDIDSTPGNKATNEDDYSTANVLTSVKTGDVVIYTTLILTVIAIVGIGLYMIKKKVLI
jgi:serine-aspartate repeat-containing protein D (fragment)